MEQIKITINTVNAAFDGAWQHEVARILRELADTLENVQRQPESLLDVNGNKVGKVEYTD